jgi:hypothetical protein
MSCKAHKQERVCTSEAATATAAASTAAARVVTHAFGTWRLALIAFPSETEIAVAARTRPIARTTFDIAGAA